MYAGFVNGDSASSLTAQAVCTTTATAASDVGTYPATCSGAVDPDYAISYVDGSVTVSPAPVTITAVGVDDLRRRGPDGDAHDRRTPERRGRLGPG